MTEHFYSQQHCSTNNTYIITTVGDAFSASCLSGECFQHCNRCHFKGTCYLRDLVYWVEGKNKKLWEELISYFPFNMSI
jgi:hypothetical protein